MTSIQNLVKATSTGHYPVFVRKGLEGLLKCQNCIVSSVNSKYYSCPCGLVFFACSDCMAEHLREMRKKN